jgi:hypothetical protein
VTQGASKFLSAGRDFVELTSDCSNAVSIIDKIHDESFATSIVESCWSQLESSTELAIEKHIERTLEFSYFRMSSNNKVSAREFELVILKHRDQTARHLKSAKVLELGRKKLRRATPDSVVNAVRSFLMRF